MKDTKLKKAWNKLKRYSIPVAGILTFLALNHDKGYAQKINEGSELTHKLVTPGETYNGQNIMDIFLQNLDAFFDLYMPHAIIRIGEEANVAELEKEIPSEIYNQIALNELFLKLNINPGISGLSQDDNPIDINKVKELLKQNKDYNQLKDYKAILFSKFENINPEDYIGLSLSESNKIDNINQKIDYITTFASRLNKNKNYEIKILKYKDTPEAKKKSIESGVRTTIMDMLNAAYADEVITKAIDDTTKFSSQLMNLSEGDYSLHFAPETGMWKVVSGNGVIGEINLKLDKIISNYNAQKEQYKKTGEKPEIASVEKSFIEYIHPALEGTQIDLSKFKSRFNELNKLLSNIELPDVLSEDVELCARRLSKDISMLSEKKKITLDEMNYFDPVDPQKRGFSLSSRELYNNIANVPGADLLLPIAQQFALLTNDITNSVKTETGVAAVEKKQTETEIERLPELKQLIKERARVFVGPIIGYSDGSLVYGGAIYGKWTNLGIGLEGYHNAKSSEKDESKHNQNMGLGFTGDLTRIIKENYNQTMLNALILKSLDNKDRFWGVFGLGLNWFNESNSIYERTIVWKDNNKIDDTTQPSGTSDKGTYPVLVLGLDGYLHESGKIGFQLKAYYSKKYFGINGTTLFDLGRLTGIGR